MPTKPNSSEVFSRKVAGIISRFVTPLLRFQTTELASVFAIESHQWRVGTQAVPKKGLIYIIARSAYREFEKTYPIENRSDLKAVLDQQFEGQDCIHQIQKTANHQSLVKTFVFDSQLMQSLPAFCVLLPESLVLHAALQQKHCKVALVDQAYTWFLYVRAEHFSSQLASRLCSDLNTFSMVNGVPQEIEELNISPGAKPALLLQGLKSLSPALLLNFVRYKRPQGKALPWRAIGITAFVVLLGYFSASTLYLNWTATSAAQAIAGFGPDVDQVMAQKQQFEDLKTKLDKTQQLLAQQKSSLPVWSLLLHLLQSGANISAFQWQNGQLVVQGTTPVATALVEAITKLPYVSKAAFSEATRRERELDSFSIKIEFRQEAVNAAK